VMNHYRHDGFPRKTLCGEKIVLGSRPQMLERKIDWMPPPLSPEAIESLRNEGHLRIDCPRCVECARTLIEAAKLKAKTGFRPPRPASQDDQWITDAKRVANAGSGSRPDDTESP
jgi:hypothetical protein